MSFNLVFDNLRKMREDADYIIRIVKEHQKAAEPDPTPPSGPVPSSPVGVGIPLYFVHPDDSRLLSEKLRIMGKAVAELQPLLLGKGEFVTNDEFRGYITSFGEHVDRVRKAFSQAYDAINSAVQGYSDDGSFLGFMNDFRRDILQLERRVLDAEALSLDAPSVEDSYVLRAVESGLAKMEDEKTRVRQKVFLRSDPEGKRLLHIIFHAESEKERNEAVGRLMYLASFDYEIYYHLSGNLDVLVYHASERIGILIETTISKPLKDKVDQVIARRREYEEYFAELLGPNPRIHPLLVTTNDNPQLSPEAKADAMQNEVSIFTRKEMEELINLLKKGKLNRQKVVDMILKNVPT